MLLLSRHWRGVRGRWNPPLKVLSWMSPSPPIVEKEVPRIKLVCTIDPLKEKRHLSWDYTTKFQQNISNLVIQMKKKHTETITYIKTTVCVETTSRCVRMSRLKHVGRTTIVTVRDREVRRDGGIFPRLVGVQFSRTTPFSPQLLFHLIKRFKLNINQNNAN